MSYKVTRIYHHTHTIKQSIYSFKSKIFFCPITSSLPPFLPFLPSSISSPLPEEVAAWHQSFDEPVPKKCIDKEQQLQEEEQVCVCLCVCVCVRERERERECGWAGGRVLDTCSYFLLILLLLAHVSLALPCHAQCVRV